MVLPKLKYRHVDVFSAEPLSGNGLIVFEPEEELTVEVMQALTREMRQFESIFLFKTAARSAFRARIFTMEEELPFAGHPLLGAAAVLHEREAASSASASWTIQLQRKVVPINTFRKDTHYRAEMDQGVPEFGRVLSRKESTPFLRALNLDDTSLPASLPLQLISTGLPYLIVPIQNGLEKARIVVDNFEAMLSAIDAQFVYVLDVAALEGRTWDNRGLVEDVATGSAAGPAGAYLTRYGLSHSNREIVLTQGRFVGRPSRLHIKLQGPRPDELRALVSGEVCMIGSGRLGI